MGGRRKEVRTSLVRKRWLIPCGLVSVAIGLWGVLTGCQPPEGQEAVSRGSTRWTATDESGRQWVLLAWKASGAAGQGQVRPDHSNPLVGEVNVDRRSRDLVNFSLEVTTPAGEQLYLLTVADRVPAEPAFAITDASGQEVARGKFEYG